MADVCQVAATHADGMHFGHFVGDGAEGRHRSEGHALEVHVESCHDDAHATVGKFVTHFGQPVVEELRLVDTHHVDV